MALLLQQDIKHKTPAVFKQEISIQLLSHQFNNLLGFFVIFNITLQFEEITF